MSGLCGKIDSLLRLLSFWSVFFNHKAELKLRYLFDDKNSLQVFAYLAKIYTYNIQIIPPPTYFGQLYLNRIVYLLR